MRRGAQRTARSRQPSLTHLDARGRARMVDVSAKEETAREALAEATVSMRAATWELVAAGRAAKGDVLAAARIAGIMAAKRTPELIPLCHPLPLSSVAVDFSARPAGRGRVALRVTAAARCTGRTGVEMEALAAAAVAALTVYDMCKAADRWMSVREVRLLAKSGGTSGPLRRPGTR